MAAWYPSHKQLWAVSVIEKATGCKKDPNQHPGAFIDKHRAAYENAKVLLQLNREVRKHAGE